MGLDKETQDRIVSIQIPLADGKSEYFSGYIFANGYLITCLHGFMGSDEKHIYDTDQKIKIISQGVEESLELSSEDPDALLENDKIILYKSEKYDVVILHHKNLKGGFQQLHLDELEEKGEFDAGGYPYFNHKNSEDSNGFTPFHGTHSAIAHKSKLLDLSSITIQVPKMEHWREVSGSPVFVDNKLTGIIQKYDKYDDQYETYELKNLKATYLKRLWEDEDETFQDFLKKNIISVQSSFFRPKVETILDDCSDLKEEIAHHLNVTKDSVVDRLLSNRSVLVETFLLFKKSNKFEQIDKLDELFLYSVLSTYENETCFEKEPTEEKIYTDIPVATLNACEFLMAAYDKRHVHLIRDDKGRVAPGKYNLLSPPEFGIESSKYTEKSIQESILSGKANDEELIERIFGDQERETWRTYSKEKKENMVKAKLKDRNGTYYWLLEVEGKLNNLRDIFGKLPIKILNGAEDVDGSIEQQEKKWFSNDNLSHFIKDK
jgi:hypothetical protein